VNFSIITTLAVCSKNGSLRYNSSSHQLEVCSVGFWNRIVGANTLAGCSKTGAIDYDSTNSTFKYCRGNTFTWWNI
jgi:hypothetical protein